MINIEGSFSSIQIPNCSFLLTTDVSKSGWGAIFDKETTGGHFTLDESLLHIVLELKAVLFELKSLSSHLRQTHIKVLSDNTTAVHAINNMGSCKSLLCDQEVRKIWSWAIERDIFSIIAAHIPSILNVEEDQESRESELRTEWKLHESIFGYLKNYLDFYLSVDLFASRINVDFLLINQTKKLK